VPDRTPTTYSGTDVLPDNADSHDAATLGYYDYRLRFERSLELQEPPIPVAFDAKRLHAIHRYLLQAVHDWAGEHRTVDMSKRSSHIACAALIDSDDNATVFKDIAADKYLADLDKNGAWNDSRTMSPSSTPFTFP
jgi:fido (protein-threonine AMPylation protein)